MCSPPPTTGDEELPSKNVHTALRTSFSSGVKQHLKRCLFAIPPILVFYRQTANLNPFFRLITNCAATIYYPSLCLVTSLSLSPLLFLRRQTKTLQSLLTGLLDAMVTPLRHIKSPTLNKVSETMSNKSAEVLKEEKLGGRKVVLWVLIKMVRKVVDARFGEVFKEEGLSAESLGKVAGREVVGLVLGPVQNSLMMTMVGIASGASLFAAMPFVLLRLFRK